MTPTKKDSDNFITTLVLSEELVERLDAEAALHDRNRSSMIRSILKKYFDLKE